MEEKEKLEEEHNNILKHIRKSSVISWWFSLNEDNKKIIEGSE